MGNNGGIVKIGCFENCSQLEQITLPQNIVELAGWTFTECHKLISLVVPPRVRTIGYHGLNGNAIKHITFQGKVPPQMNNSMPFYEKIKTIEESSNQIFNAIDEMLNEKLSDTLAEIQTLTKA